MCCVCVTSRTALIFVGNSYENSKEINVTISVDDKVLYNGFLKAYEIPMLLEKKTDLHPVCHRQETKSAQMPPITRLLKFTVRFLTHLP